MGDSPEEQELDELIVRAVEHAGQPISLVKLAARLPRPLQRPPGRIGERVAALARCGRLHVWPGRPERIALETYDAWVRSTLLALFHSSGPLTPAEIDRKLPPPARKRRADV